MELFSLQKVLVGVSDAIHSLKQNPRSLACSFTREEEGTRLVCLIEDAFYFLSVEQIPSVTPVWVEKHRTFWIWACEWIFPCEKSYYIQILFHYPKWTQVQPHSPSVWVEFASPIFQAWFLLQQDKAISLLKMTVRNFNFVSWFLHF